MLERSRLVLLLILALATAALAERVVSARARARRAFAEAALENMERLGRLEAARIARLEAEADRVRAVAEEIERRARGRRWATSPATEPPPGPARPAVAAAASPGPEAAKAAPPARTAGLDRIRGQMRAIEGEIVPALGGGAGEIAEVALERLRRPDEEDPGGEDRAGPHDDAEPPRRPGTGLRGEYWKFVDVELGGFPDVDRRLPTVVRVDPRIAFPAAESFGLPFLFRNIAVRWRGFLYVEAEGVHTFELTSDDGSWLLLDGRVAIENGGLHPPRAREAEVYLTEGYHPLEVRFFQNEGAAAAVLSWVPVEGEPGPVPTGVLYPAEQVRAAEAPAIERILPERARSGATVTIEGSGFPSAPEPVEATFDGVDMRAEAVTPRSIRATVPEGVDRGQVVVRVRDRSSLGYPYESGDVFGLLGEYTASPEDQPIQSLSTAPRPGTAAAFRRVEPAIAFRSAGAFRLPFPARRFVARYTGALSVLEPGEYRLKLASDDGARLAIGGRNAIDIDGPHPMLAAEAAVHLERGLHDIYLEYFQNDGGAGLVLEWMPPGRSGFALVPRRGFYPPPFSGRVDPPRVDALRPPRVSLDEDLEIEGAGFAAVPGADRVLLNGRPIEVLSATPARLIVRVPRTARSGSVVVQSGELVSEPFPLEVIGRGLRGAYFRFDRDLDRIPEGLDRMEPGFERLDPVLRFGEGYSFGLPFPPERFAARWTGEIEAPAGGVYRFDLASDDGARLAIDGRTVADNDGLHPHRGVSGEVELAAGRHAIAVEYFQSYGYASLDLWWHVPGRRHPERVPDTALYPDRR